MATTNTTHIDYAEEAECAERACAWPQAAALWRRAAETVGAGDLTHLEARNHRDRYEAAAAQCDRRVDVGARVAEIAKRVLWIDTLDTRKSDRLDFHELAVWNIKKALVAAYEAGRTVEG